MSITETFHFDKEGEVVRFPLFRRLFLTFAIILLALLSFGVGRLSGGKRGGVSINFDPGQSNTPTRVASAGAAPEAPITKTAPAQAGSVFASSQGKCYYYPGCSSTVSEKNKITFASASMAEAAGNTLAFGCKAP